MINGKEAQSHKIERGGVVYWRDWKEERGKI